MNRFIFLLILIQSFHPTRAQPVSALYLGAGLQYVTTGVPIAGGDAEYLFPLRKNALTLSGGVYFTMRDKADNRMNRTLYPVSLNYRWIFKQEQKGYFQLGLGPVLHIGEPVVSLNMSIGSANARKPGPDISGILKIGGSGYYFIGGRLAFGFGLKK